MASSVLTGQGALCVLPPAPSQDREHDQTMATYELPVQLKITQNQAKKKGTSSGVLGNGMDVYKVSKVRKLSEAHEGYIWIYHIYSLNTPALFQSSLGRDNNAVLQSLWIIGTFL